MRREELLREIAEIDEEINRVVASSTLPDLTIRPFPLGTWIFAILCFGWVEFGYMIPGAYLYHLRTAGYISYFGFAVAFIAFLSTISWFVRRRGYRGRNNQYFTATRQARDLQERRRDLQAELRAISGK